MNREALGALLGCAPTRPPPRQPGPLTEAQAEASVLPLITDAGQVTVCSAVSGTADEAANMPRRLTLTRWHADASYTSADYELAPTVYEDPPEGLNASEALHGFAAWLMSRSEVVSVSESHGTAELLDLLAAFIVENALPPVRDHFGPRVKHPKA